MGFLKGFVQGGMVGVAIFLGVMFAAPPIAWVFKKWLALWF